MIISYGGVELSIVTSQEVVYVIFEGPLYLFSPVYMLAHPQAEQDCAHILKITPLQCVIFATFYLTHIKTLLILIY